MTLNRNGLLWDVPSPSFWRLELPAHGAALDVSYLGGTWCLFLERDGDVSCREFPTRDDAIGLVEEAFATAT